MISIKRKSIIINYLILLYKRGIKINFAIAIKSLIFLIMLVCSGCYNDYSPELMQDANIAKQVTTYDSLGKPVNMYFNKVPERVIVSQYDNLETLLAFGLGNKIILTSIDQNGEVYKDFVKRYPEEIKKVHIVAKNDFDLETAISVEPDLIIGWKSTFSSRYLRNSNWWNLRGVNTYIVATSNKTVPYGKITDEYRYLQDIGKIFDIADRSENVINEVEKIINEAKQYYSGNSRQKVMVIELLGKGIINYDSGWLVGDMVNNLGGYMPVKERSINAENLIMEDPDVIFFVTFNDYNRGLYDDLLTNVKYNSLSAVKNKRIYPIPLRYMYSPGIRIIDGMKLIRQGLYPESFSSLFTEQFIC